MEKETALEGASDAQFRLLLSVPPCSSPSILCRSCLRLIRILRTLNARRHFSMGEQAEFHSRKQRDRSKRFLDTALEEGHEEFSHPFQIPSSTLSSWQTPPVAIIRKKQNRDNG